MITWLSSLFIGREHISGPCLIRAGATPQFGVTEARWLTQALLPRRMNSLESIFRVAFD